MSGRRSLRVSQGVTNAAAASRSHRSHGIASAQLTARLSGRMGGALLGSASTPALGRRAHSHHSIHVPNLKGGENPLPPLDGWGGATPPRPSTTAGAYGRPSSSNPEIGAGENGRLFTPPNGCGGGGANGLLDDRGADIPLGLSKLDREDLEVYVNIVRANLARQAKKEQAASASPVDDETVQVNNIPQVATQSDFRALIKAQNIPHPSYDIDGDGVVSQEDYALAKRFDVNGDGVLDEAEKVVGRRIMTEVFLDNHKHDLHLYGQGLAQKVRNKNGPDR
ncbi:unnamed protein product [Ectocarpus sp. 12 AP-2014]